MDISVENESYTITFSDQSSITRCYLDYAFGLIVSDQRDTMEVRIEQSFRFRHRSAIVAVDPGSPETTCQLFGTIHASVTSVNASKTGELSILIEDDREIMVEAGNGYEPWELVTSRDERIVSMPDGGLAIWSQGGRS